MLAAVPYRISLEDLFNGPFDLLLFLVRKQEIDVQTVSLSRIVHDFQEYLEVLEILDFDLAADFVVTASTLAEIKSQMALVRNEPDEEEPEEELTDAAPGNFVEHLLAYKRLKEAAETLQEQALAWHDRYPRLTDERPNARRSSADDFIKDVEVWDLVGAFARIVRKKSDDSEHKLKFDETPIHVYVDRIGKIIREQGRVLFQSLFEENADRSQVIGMFLAVLELVRHHGYLAEQADDFNEIWLMPPTGEDDDRLPTKLSATSHEDEGEQPSAEQPAD
ncbi:MAG: segregation and condensation protein A [Rubinisphaera brasiliensis]|uniref:segregation and condensation protein A n=1 Tax=Rubinisphaera brasiliensis TaxID=119 RepID=UPI00391B7B16